MKEQRYIIGKSPMPEWCVGKLMQYRKADGSTGFELHFESFGIHKTVELAAGDQLIKTGNRIEFKRRVKTD